MSQSKFNIEIGDIITFLGPDDSCFENNGKYRVLTVNTYGEYPYGEYHQNDLAKQLINPKALTIKDRYDDTFILVYTDDGFANNFDTTCDYSKFDVVRRLRKEKLIEIDKNK